MAPVKLYGMALSPNVVRVASVLNEKGLDFEIINIDLPSGAHKHPDFLVINPFGQIPALVDGDDVLYESRAITRYIATKYASEGTPLLPATASAKLEVWLETESHHFSPNAAPLVMQLLFAPLMGGATDQALVEKHARQLAEVLDVYEVHLAKNKYLAGDEFTLADANHAAHLLYLSMTPKAGLVADRPHVKAWSEDIAARPAFQKTAAAIPFPKPPPSA